MHYYYTGLGFTIGNKAKLEYPTYSSLIKEDGVCVSIL